MKLAAIVLAFAVTSLLSVGIATVTARGFAPGGPAQAVRTGIAAGGVAALHDVASIDVTITIGGESRRAIVSEPVGAASPRPVVVLVHGSGPADRTALAAEAEALAARGVVAIRYDKRASETGPFRRDYALLADDAAAVARWAASRPGVDPQRIGVAGWSEGGWVAPLAAARHEAIAFVVMVSAPVVTPIENAAFTVDHAISGTPLPVRALAGSILAGGRELLDYGAFDMREQGGRLHVPVHAVFGADDSTVPVADAIDRLRSVAPQASVEIVAGAGHVVPVAGGWLDRVADLVLGVGVPQPGATVGAAPTQSTGLPRLAERSWVLDPRLHLAAAAAAAAAAALLVPRRSTARCPATEEHR